ncbi:hypothetical protein C1T17_02830 [Sphingobium sp. SCG-1]|nr:hypothetical protein C1T17_02830 [Sphingobium sp. SCG-1]
MAPSEANDPRLILEDTPMSRPQIVGILITALLSALDGYDLLAAAFVAPALAQEFKVGASGLGVLLSTGLGGTLVGAFLLAPLADLIGRKPVVLGSLAIMTVGMLASALVSSIEQMAAIRLITGIGISATMVIVNPVAAELSNMKNRVFVVAIKAIGSGSAAWLVAGSPRRCRSVLAGSRFSFWADLSVLHHQLRSKSPWTERSWRLNSTSEAAINVQSEIITETLGRWSPAVNRKPASAGEITPASLPTPMTKPAPVARLSTVKLFTIRPFIAVVPP